MNCGFGVIYNGECYYGDTNDWHEAERHKNATVHVLKDSKGNVSYGWTRQENTESEYYEEAENEQEENE